MAGSGLLDVPTTPRGVQKQANELNWRAYPQLARRRKGRGAGWEYHWTLFPKRAQAQLLAQSSIINVPASKPPLPKNASQTAEREDMWAWFEGLNEGPKAKARNRLEIIQVAEALETGGLTRDHAVRDAAKMFGVAARSIWNWRDMIEGVRRVDRLPYLAPRHGLATRKSRARTVDPEFGDLITSDYLRPERPTLTSVYDRCVRVAQAKGIEIAPIHTVRRWLERPVSEPAKILAREGLDALKEMYPSQVRDRSKMHAMEGINGDFHRFDVFVRFPGLPGQPEEIIRPQMVAFQDLRSNKILSWRVDKTANSHAVQLCLGDLIEEWGIPKHVLLDNGREFAAKAITGGSKTRFRFKIKDDDIPGLLTTLDCQIHWATPYSGQSKPIERAFRDMCDRVAKHPRLAGAYTGNRPDAKPENYGTRAVPLDEFLAVLTEEITAHNTRPGRRTEIAYGRSFAEVFAESYATAPIRKATAEQRRLWLMGAQGLSADKKTGQIRFMGNAYWSDWMHTVRGQKVVARFDQARLWDGLHIYALSGEYLGHAACREKAGFFDVEEGRAHAKARGDWLKAEKAALRAHKKLTAAQLAGELEAIAPTTSDEVPLEAKVVRMVPTKRAESTVETPKPEADHAQAALIADMASHRAARDGAQDADSDRAEFARARELEQLVDAGGVITKDQEKWLASFQRTAIYKALLQMEEDFGEGVLAKETPPRG
jgi:hypothetical protein